MFPGTWKTTRPVLPNRVDADVTTPFTVGPPLAVAGVRVTVVFAAERLPDGKPLPVTVTVVTPGCAVAGVADADKVTAAAAAARTTNPRTITSAPPDTIKLR